MGPGGLCDLQNRSSRRLRVGRRVRLPRTPAKPAWPKPDDWLERGWLGFRLTERSEGFRHVALQQLAPTRQSSADPLVFADKPREMTEGVLENLGYANGRGRRGGPPSGEVDVLNLCDCP